MMKVHRMSLAWVSGWLVALAWTSPGFAAKSPKAQGKSPYGFVIPTDREALRAEIILREKRLLNGYDEPYELLTALAASNKEYLARAGGYLGFYYAAVKTLTKTCPEMQEFERLREQHKALQKEAQNKGVLLSEKVVQMMRSHTSPTRTIFGMPVEAMSFDKGKIKAAAEIRKKQYDLFKRWKEVAAQYEKRFSPSVLAKINRELMRRYNALGDYRKRVEIVRRRLEDLFDKETYEHCLGTPKMSDRARRRKIASRVLFEDLPGAKMKGLPLMKVLQLPERIAAPKEPPEFEVCRDGFKYLDAAIRTQLDQAKADSLIMSLESAHVAWKLVDTCRSMVVALAHPFQEGFSRKEESFGVKLGRSLLGLGKAMTWDAAKGAIESGGRLLGQVKDAVAGSDREKKEALAPLVACTSDVLNRLKLAVEKAGPAPSPAEVGDSPQAKLEYLKRLEDYRGLAKKQLNELKDINRRFDKSFQTAMDVFDVYMAGKGVKEGFAKMKERWAERRQGIVRCEKAVREITDGRCAVKSVLSETQKVSPEIKEAAKKFAEADDALMDTAKRLDEIQKKLDDTLKRIDEERAAGKIDTKAAEQVRKNVEECPGSYSGGGEPAGDFKPPKAISTEQGGVIEVKGRLGGGTFGEVYSLSDTEVVKFYKKLDGAPAELSDPLANMRRELQGERLATEAGIGVAKTVRSGALPDGTPFAVKERIPPENLATSVLEKNGWTLPSAHQMALLKLTKKLADNHLLAGDLSPGNVFFEKLPNGAVVAKLLEGDFIKKMPESIPPQTLLKAQLDWILAKGKNPMMEQIAITQHFPGGSVGRFAGAIDERGAAIFESEAGVEVKLEANLGDAVRRSGELKKLIEEAKKGGGRPRPSSGGQRPPAPAAPEVAQTALKAFENALGGAGGGMGIPSLNLDDFDLPDISDASSGGAGLPDLDINLDFGRADGALGVGNP